MLFFAPQGARARGQGSALRLVRAATVASVDLDHDAAAGDVIDGVTLAAGDYLLVKDQAAPAENGVYVVKPAGAPVRATWADSAKDLDGLSVLVAEGTVNADTAWQQVEEDVHVGMGPVTWAPLAGAKLFQALSERGQPGGYAPLDSDSRVPLGHTYRNTLSVKAATVGAGLLSGNFEAGDSIDGVVLSVGDFILIKDQTDEKENGVYSVNASGAPTRISVSLDGLIVFVREGNTQRSTLWAQTKSSPVPGTDPISFVPTGATAPITQKSGNYTVTPKDDTIVVDASAGPVTVTLPSASTVPGKPITVKKRDSTANAVTISGTVDGEANPKITGKDQSVTIKSDGSEYRTLAQAKDQDQLWDIDFFRTHGRLPPVRRVSSYHSIPTADAAFGSDVTITRALNYAKASFAAVNRARREYWDLGSPKGRILCVVNGYRCKSAKHSPAIIFTDVGNDALTNLYQATLELNASRYHLYKRQNGGSYAGIETVTNPKPPDDSGATANPFEGFAFSFEPGLSPRLLVLVRRGSFWYPIHESNDSTFGAGVFRYVALQYFLADNPIEDMYFFAPFQIWSD